MLLVCPQVLSWRDMEPRTVGGVPKVHAGSWEHFFLNCKACESLACADLCLGDVGVE